MTELTSEVISFDYDGKGKLSIQNIIQHYQVILMVKIKVVQ